MSTDGKGYKSGPQCKVCSKEFKAKNSLSNHYMKIHKQNIELEGNSSAKHFQCQTCNMNFTSNGYLTQHLKKHSGLKLFECQTCSKTFNLKGHLKRHGKLHGTSKPFLKV